ncbi:MAG: hypothetical protein Q8O89_05075 [Nanoarchaeota archaeon]|nr:hypothetical protein [Nanoarchaeota archaeon]
MPNKIILPLRSLSEKKFFSIMQNNRIVSLKHFYKKMPRKQVYQIMRRLDAIQKCLQSAIFTKKIDYCSVTGKPVIVVYFNSEIKFHKLENNEEIAVISPLAA